MSEFPHKGADAKPPALWPALVFTYAAAPFQAHRAKQMGLKTSRYWTAAATGLLTWVLLGFASVFILVAVAGGGSSSGSQVADDPTSVASQGRAVQPGGGATDQNTKPRTVPDATGVSPTQTIRNVLKYRFDAFTTGNPASLSNYYASHDGTLWDNDIKLIRGGANTGNTYSFRITDVEATEEKITANVAVDTHAKSGEKTDGESQPYVFEVIDNGNGPRWYATK